MSTTKTKPKKRASILDTPRKKSKKAFDCVEFKRELQRKLARRYKGMTWDQRIAAMQRRLETSDDPFVKRWRSLPEDGPSGARKK